MTEVKMDSFKSLPSYIDFQDGEEGVATLTFTDTQEPGGLTKFIIFIRDAVANPILFYDVPYFVNLQPVLSSPELDFEIFPSPTVNGEILITSQIVDPEAESLKIVGLNLPAYLTLTVNSTHIILTGKYPSSPQDESFQVQVDDSVSAPVTFKINLKFSTCHSSCKHCSGDAQNNCLSCNGHQILSNSTCVKDCAEGFFKSNNNCIACDDSCK